MAACWCSRTNRSCCDGRWELVTIILAHRVRSVVRCVWGSVRGDAGTKKLMPVVSHMVAIDLNSNTILLKCISIQRLGWTGQIITPVSEMRASKSSSDTKHGNFRMASPSLRPAWQPGRARFEARDENALRTFPIRIASKSVGCGRIDCVWIHTWDSGKRIWCSFSVKK